MCKFFFFIITQAHLPPKIPKKPIFTDPCINRKWNMSGVQILKHCAVKKAIQDRVNTRIF